MQAYCLVIETHPTQAIYAGSNGTGSIYIFSTKDQFAVV